MLEEWTSWAFYSHTTSMAHRIRPGYNEAGLFNFMKQSIPVPSDVIGLGGMWIDEDDALISCVVDNMQHEGVLFGLPEETEVEGVNGFKTTMRDDDGEEQEEPSLKVSMATSLVYVFRIATIQLFRDTIKREGSRYFFPANRGDSCFEMTMAVKEERLDGSNKEGFIWNEEALGCATVDEMDLESAAVFCNLFSFRKEIAKVFIETIEREGLEYFKGILGKERSFDLSLVIKVNPDDVATISDESEV
jgi:hypothetical protein